MGLSWKLKTQILFTVLVTLSYCSSHAAVCSRVYTFADGSILTASQLNTEFNTAINCINSINEDNIAANANFDPTTISPTIAGDGLGRDGSTGILSVNIDDVGIEISGDDLQLKNSGVVTAKIADANVTRAKLESSVQDSLLPAGVVLPYVANVAPSGFLLCEGQAVSRITYSALFAIIGITHGQGDGSTTFNVPDYRGRFMRGYDVGLRDPDVASRTAMNTGGNVGANIGSVQTSQYAAHTHPPASTQSDFVGSTLSAIGDTVAAGSYRSIRYATATGSSGGNETRPINAYVNYIIKY